MIGVARENGHRSIELFAGHHPDQLVGPGHLAEAQNSMREGGERGVESIRAADRHRIGRLRGVSRPADVGGPLLAGRRRPSLVEQNQRGALGHGGEDRRALRGPPFVRPPRPRFANLPQVDAGEARASRALGQPLEVAIEQQTLRPRLQFADANQREAHGSAPGRCQLLADTVEKAVKYSLLGGEARSLSGEWLQGLFRRLPGPPSGRYAASICGSILIGLKRASRLRFWAVAARRNSSLAPFGPLKRRRARPRIRLR